MNNSRDKLESVSISPSPSLTKITPAFLTTIREIYNLTLFTSELLIYSLVGFVLITSGNLY